MECTTTDRDNENGSGSRYHRIPAERITDLAAVGYRISSRYAPGAGICPGERCPVELGLRCCSPLGVCPSLGGETGSDLIIRVGDGEPPGGGELLDTDT